MKYKQEEINPYDKEREKAIQVEDMFDNIAPDYDKLNHIMSFHIDKIWRKRAMKWLKQFEPKVMMDVASGTGDFAIQANKYLHPEKIVATDISEGMMNVGRRKVKELGIDDIITFEKEDCLNLTYGDDTYDAVTAAFGIRNFQNLEQGIAEMYRVLKPNGKLAILELTTPVHFPMKQLFKVYSLHIMPLMGRMISKDKSAYEYLPSTIQAFPQGEVMMDMFKRIGFKEYKFRRLTFGICTLYMASK